MVRVQFVICCHFLAIRRDPAAPLIGSMENWPKIIQKALLQVFEIGFQSWLGQFLTVGQAGKADGGHNDGRQHLEERLKDEART